jgi:hypothetical protein
VIVVEHQVTISGADPRLQVRGGKLRLPPLSAKFVGVFRVKNHDFMPKNHIFSNCGGRHENFWGILCENNNNHSLAQIYYTLLTTDAT